MCSSLPCLSYRQIVKRGLGLPVLWFWFRRSGGAGLLFRGGLALGVAMSVVIIFVQVVSRVSVCDAHMTSTRCKLQPKRLLAGFLLGGKLN